MAGGIGRLLTFFHRLQRSTVRPGYGDSFFGGFFAVRLIFFFFLLQRGWFTAAFMFWVARGGGMGYEVASRMQDLGEGLLGGRLIFDCLRHEGISVSRQWVEEKVLRWIGSK